ncbi:MAG TPA: fumarylacetoacetate hydrolase family protein [Pontiella sp.]
MKLVRFGEKGKERPGVWMGDGRILDVRALAFHIEDYNEHFFSHQGIAQLQTLLTDPGAQYVEAASVRLGPPVARPSKIICVGANYADHAREFGHAIPSSPILFSKASSAVSGPTDPIVLPGESPVVDGEAELAVVIGARAQNVKQADALGYVAGYTVLNDVTERTVQKSAGQWFRGKGFDTFCPTGPYLVTPDEMPDVGNLRIWQKHNGAILQDSNTAEMIFDIPYLIEYISHGMTLLPGDLISTGTPAGIGSARDPRILMKPGDVIEAGIDGLGAQRSEVSSIRF